VSHRPLARICLSLRSLLLSPCSWFPVYAALAGIVGLWLAALLSHIQHFTVAGVIAQVSPFCPDPCMLARNYSLLDQKQIEPHSTIFYSRRHRPGKSWPSELVRLLLVTFFSDVNKLHQIQQTTVIAQVSPVRQKSRTLFELLPSRSEADWIPSNTSTQRFAIAQANCIFVYHRNGTSLLFSSETESKLPSIGRRVQGVPFP
jgi:hypothetical protein